MIDQNQKSQKALNTECLENLISLTHQLMQQFEDIKAFGTAASANTSPEVTKIRQALQFIDRLMSDLEMGLECFHSLFDTLSDDNTAESIGPTFDSIPELIRQLITLRSNLRQHLHTLQ